MHTLYAAARVRAHETKCRKSPEAACFDGVPDLGGSLPWILIRVNTAAAVFTPLLLANDKVNAEKSVPRTYQRHVRSVNHAWFTNYDKNERYLRLKTSNDTGRLGSEDRFC